MKGIKNDGKRGNLNAFGVVEIILILVIIIALVLIFKNEIEDIVSKAIQSIQGKAGQII